MIDWANLAANALWIVGCAVALATFSFASWQASIHSEKLTAWMYKPGYGRMFALAGMLFCAGQLWLAGAAILRVLWVLLGALILAAMMLSFRS
jgi:hypothetical protein